MIADVNLTGALGSMPGAPALQESGSEAESATTFAALMDEAAGARPQPAAVPGRAAAAFDLAVDPAMFTDWWLGASEVGNTLHQLREAVERSEEEPSDEASTDEESDASATQLEGVLNIEWLFARPQRLAIYTAPPGEQSASQTGEGTVRQQSPMPADEPAAAPESHVDAAALLAKLGENEPVEQPAATDESESLVNLAETFEKAVRSAFDPAPARKAESAANTEKVERPVAEAVAAKAAAAPGSGAISVEMTAGEGQVQPAADTQAEAAPRPTQAASRLARAIERLGGSSAEAAPVLRGSQTPQQESSSDNAARGFSSPQHHDTTPATAARTQAASPVFTVAGAPDVRQAAELVARHVEAPLAAAVEIPEADTVRQLVQTMRMQFRDGIGDAIVRLRPEHLGEVSISLRVEQGSVSATVQAEVAAVRHWLETHEGTLRSGLAEQGLHLEKFVVREDAGREQPGDAPEQQKRQSRRQARLRQGESEPKFEITV
jgi:flagellar hook-length control protein FliK